MLIFILHRVQSQLEILTIVPIAHAAIHRCEAHVPEAAASPQSRLSAASSLPRVKTALPQSCLVLGIAAPTSSCLGFKCLADVLPTSLNGYPIFIRGAICLLLSIHDYINYSFDVFFLS
jgi:hypothetical protein